MKVCLSTANTLRYPQGGHLWVFLNWALGLQANGCEVIWLDAIEATAAPETVDGMLSRLRTCISPYRFSDTIALASLGDQPLPAELTRSCLPLDAATEADFLLNMRCDLPAGTVSRFKRTAALDIDPGLLQFAMERGIYRLAPHDMYFTIGETLGALSASFSDAGLRWHYIPPCVSLDHWPVSPSPPGAPFTTVSHWEAHEWMLETDDRYYKNDKRAGFEPFLDIPQLAPGPFELALNLDGDFAEQAVLEAKGWRVREAHEVASSPLDFQRYIQNSCGEFSCCKPAYAKLQTAWLSDRTPCYLSSGKPAVVQHTGPSRFLPDEGGIFRFRTLEDASRQLEIVASDYPHQCKLARALAAEHFDAKKIFRRLLEDAITC
jgi:hypothetical protein